MGSDNDHSLREVAERLPDADEDEPFVRAPEPDVGWPPRPWDHRYIESSDGRWARVAVDVHGRPLIDADGDAVLSGPGFDHGLVKAGWLPGGPQAHAADTSHLDDAARSCLEVAGQIALDHGHTWVGTEHLVLAILREVDEVRVRFAGVVESATFEELMAGFYDGPGREERLAVVARRREGALPRPGPEATSGWNDALNRLITAATRMAQAAGVSHVSPVHLLVSELFRSPSLTIRWLSRAGMDTEPLLQRARAIRDWLPLISLIDEADREAPPTV